MKFEIEVDRTYPHPTDTVWRAVTERDALAAWLMETDFVPQEGQTFHMRCENEYGGTDLFLCEVITLEPPRRMVWSWELDGHQDEGKMYVELRLEPVSEGTRLTIRHYGDANPATIEKFRGGWPGKLDQLSHAATENW